MYKFIAVYHYDRKLNKNATLCRSFLATGSAMHRKLTLTLATSMMMFP